MPNTKIKVNNTVKVLRNLQIVILHRDEHLTFQQISDLPGMPKRQQCHSIFESWKNVKFRLLKDKSDFVFMEDDKVIIQ
jgi:hypothetical protein